MQTIHVLSSRPPVRAFALAALVDILGAALIVLAGVGGWPAVVSVLGALLLVAGFALIGIALWSQRKMQVQVILDDRGYSITGPGEPHRGSWSDVSKVTFSPGRLVLHHGENRRLALIHPGGESANLAGLGNEISGYLDRSRGYGRG